MDGGVQVVLVTHREEEIPDGATHGLAVERLAVTRSGPVGDLGSIQNVVAQQDRSLGTNGSYGKMGRLTSASPGPAETSTPICNHQCVYTPRVPRRRNRPQRAADPQFLLAGADGRALGHHRSKRKRKDDPSQSHFRNRSQGVRRRAVPLRPTTGLGRKPSGICVDESASSRRRFISIMPPHATALETVISGYIRIQRSLSAPRK